MKSKKRFCRVARITRNRLLCVSRYGNDLFRVPRPLGVQLKSGDWVYIDFKDDAPVFDSVVEGWAF